MPLRFIAGRILRELIGVLALSMMALPGVAVAAADVRESLGEPTSPRFDAVRRHRQPAEVLGVFFALRLVLVLPGVSRRSFVDDVLDGLSDANEGEPGLAVTTTSVTLSLPRLNCTQVHRLPPLAEHAGFRLQLTPDLVGCPTVLERVRPVAAARTCAPDLRRAWQGRPERKSLLDVARTRAEIGGVRAAARADSGPRALAGSAAPLPIRRLSPGGRS